MLLLFPFIQLNPLSHQSTSLLVQRSTIRCKRLQILGQKRWISPSPGKEWSQGPVNQRPMKGFRTIYNHRITLQLLCLTWRNRNLSEISMLGLTSNPLGSVPSIWFNNLPVTECTPKMDEVFTWIQRHLTKIGHNLNAGPCLFLAYT